MSKKPAKYNPPLAIPLPLDKLVEGQLQVDPKKLPSKQVKKPALGEPLPKPAAKGRKVVTDKKGAKHRVKEKGAE